jgi:hypothetical protein
VCLKINNKVHFVNIHRLVCEAFNGAPTAEYNICDHIDRCIINNYYKNLRWTNNSGNMANTGARKKRTVTVAKTPVIFYSLDDKELYKFENILEAHQQLGISI